MNKTFEQQIADAIRNLNAICAVLTAGLLLAIGVAVWGFANASSANDAAARAARRVQAGLSGQNANRAKNVLVWCRAINQGRDYNRAFIRHVTHGRLTYTLANLPCQALERQTLASARAHR